MVYGVIDQRPNTIICKSEEIPPRAPYTGTTPANCLNRGGPRRRRIVFAVINDFILTF